MGGSAAETPASSNAASAARPVPGLRASDADRDQAVSRLRDEFVAGRLSHETFLHRVDVVLATKQQADLPPLLADLPGQHDQRDQRDQQGRRDRSLPARFRQAWARLTAPLDPASPGDGQAGGWHWAGPRTVSPPQPARSVTTSLSAASDAGAPMMLQFPRGTGSHFTIGRDAGCDLAIQDMTVSRRHATLERTADGWLLTDLESTNGTRVNGWRVRGKVTVKAGDLVSFGKLDTVFSRGAELPRPRREERLTSSMS